MTVLNVSSADRVMIYLQVRVMVSLVKRLYFMCHLLGTIVTYK